MIIALAFPALILSLSLSLSDSSSESGPSHHSVMVVRFACMACPCGPTEAYFTTYQAAAVHYASSAACHQSLRGIAMVVLPNRPAEAEAGVPGAAEAVGWAVQTRRRHNGTSTSEHDRCQHTYCIPSTDIYPMSRILYDFVFTVYNIVEKPTISHTTSGRGGYQEGF